ncbi:MAG: type I glutamate--ammonia ligase [Candidatus Woesearchaeota archaeon]
MDKNEELMDKVKKDNVKFIQLQFNDLHGMIKSVTIPVEKLKESIEKGTWFDGSSIEGFTRIAESDMYLKPDISTYAVLPWENHEKSTARIICDVYTPDNKPFEGDPRYILKKVMKEAEEMGFEYNVGPELEFFLFKPNEKGEIVPAPHDIAGYFDFSPRDLAGDVRKEIIFALESMGLEIEMSHHEVAPGQHEIDFKFGNALGQADKCMTFKHAVKSIANKFSLYATFMPKPIFGINGSGMHVHQSLFDISTQKNIFFDDKDEYKLSDVAKSFIAGQLVHVKGFCAITAPTVNSYKRLVPGYEAPVYLCWARRNRSALIRIPRYSPGREQSTRAELRCPDPSANPYLAFAVMLKAGLDGIKNKLTPPNPVEEDVYKLGESKLLDMNIITLPSSLGEAISELKKDTLIQEVLGAHTYPLYIKAKIKEWNNYRIQVTKWEIDNYLENI